MSWWRLARRKIVIAWFILQAASLAGVARDCCAAHVPTAEKTRAETCHQQPANDDCPMRAADGTPCPMHRPQAADLLGTVWQGSCSGPLQEFGLILSIHGALPGSRVEVVPPSGPFEHLRQTAPLILARLSAPDPHPPRV